METKGLCRSSRVAGGYNQTISDGRTERNHKAGDRNQTERKGEKREKERVEETKRAK